MKHLDENPLVEKFIYEPFAIPYVSNSRTGKVRRYYPDLAIEYIDGSRCLVEIKPSSKIKKPTVIKKTNAAIAWCLNNGMIFSFITEKDLKSLGLL